MAKSGNGVIDAIIGSGGFLGTILNNIVNIFHKYAGTGVTDSDSQYLDKQDEILDENREEDYMIRKRAWDEMDSPEAQMRSQSRGLAAVGVNKMALAGNVAEGASNSTSAGSVSGNSSQGDIGSLIGAFSDIAGLSSKIKDMKASADLKASQAKYQDIQNKWADKFAALRYKNEEFSGQLTQANIRKVIAESSNLEWQALYAPDLFQSQIDERNSNVERNASEISLNASKVEEINSIVAKNAKEIEQIDALIQKINAEYWELVSRRDLNEAMIRESNKRIEKYDAQIKEIGANINLVDKDLEFYIWNHAQKSHRSYGAGVGVDSYYTPGDLSDEEYFKIFGVPRSN